MSTFATSMPLFRAKFPPTEVVNNSRNGVGKHKNEQAVGLLS